ncbi:MAG: TatD family hydrolase [Rikenellaceae bacterium]|nr:TatD family hydrolase [Rikenellaceae bacterium]
MQFIDIHTHKIYHDGTISPPSAGVHPWDAADVDLAKELEYLSHAPVAAIGEVGLDYARARDMADRTRQQTVLRAQLAVAGRRALPVVIHCARAWGDMLPILSEYTLAAVIFHGYIGSPRQTAALLTRDGYYLSFGVRSLHSPKTVQSLRLTPPDRLFAETDDDPTPISDIYCQIADIKDMPLDALIGAIERSYEKLFGARLSSRTMHVRNDKIN